LRRRIQGREDRITGEEAKCVKADAGRMLLPAEVNLVNFFREEILPKPFIDPLYPPLL
jgi:hypothetical protein